jgi:hypothetical protein
MPTAVYAVFPSHDAAQSAVHAVLRRQLPEEVLGLQLHSDVLDVHDLPAAATFATRWASWAAVVFGGIGAFIGSVGAEPSGTLFGAISGALVGTLVAASSGRITPKPEIARLRDEVERGRTIVTMDITRGRVAREYERFFTDHGALQVGMT